MKTQYQYVIVGSGIAATLVTEALLKAEPSTEILVLEAGDRIKMRDRSSWWDLVLRGKTPYSKTYDIEKGPDKESFSTGGTGWLFNESRVRAFGGSTMHWGGWSLRLQVEDFECHTRTGKGADWPFGYEELEPWYEQAEEVLAVGGAHDDKDSPPRRGGFPLPAFPWTAHESQLAEALESSGLNPGHMPIARFHRCMTTGTCKYCPIGSRYTAQEHMQKLLGSGFPNLEVRTLAPVLQLRATKDRVTGVVFLNGTEEAEVHAERVVICAGAYESPKLLLRSRSVYWPQGIGNATDQVGRYLVTHSMLRVKGVSRANPERWFQEYDFPTLMSRSWDSEARQRRGKVFLFNNRSLPRVDLGTLMVEGKRRDAVDTAAEGPRFAGLDAFIEEFGHRDNRVLLGQSTGQFGLPNTEVHFTRADEMEPESRRVLDEMAKLLARGGYTVAEGDKTLQLPRGDHSTGTCRMGKDESESVTNSDLRVHGIENLFVCSNAVFPSVGAVNPTLTLAALSLRLGAYLTGERGITR
jgi:choline dehydrogenase-like flavoprotein